MSNAKQRLEVESLSKEILEEHPSHPLSSFAYLGWEDKPLSDILRKWEQDLLTKGDEVVFEKLVYDAMDAACVALLGDPLHFAFAHTLANSAWVKEVADSLIKINV